MKNFAKEKSFKKTLNMFLSEVGYPVTKDLEMDGVLKDFVPSFQGPEGICMKLLCVWNLQAAPALIVLVQSH